MHLEPIEQPDEPQPADETEDLLNLLVELQQLVATDHLPEGVRLAAVQRALTQTLGGTVFDATQFVVDVIRGQMELATAVVPERPFISACRTGDEVLQAEQSLCDRIWYDRKVVLLDKIAASAESELAPEQRDAVLRRMAKLEQRYGGRDQLMPSDDFEWGMWNGKLSALRWLMGDDWDSLYT